MSLQIQKQVLLSLSLTGVFLSVLLLYFNAKKFTSAIYLGVFFFLISLYGLYYFVFLFSNSTWLVTVFLLGIPVFGSMLYLIGPMAYWYVRSVLTDDPHLKKRDLWHFLPMIIFFLAALPNLFSPLSTHVAAATAMVNNAGAMQHYKPTLLSGILSFPVLFLSRPVLVLVYTLWATKQYFHYLLRKRGSSVFSQQYFMTKWLPVLLGSLFVLVISHMLMVIDFTVKGSHVFFTLHTLQILSGLGLTALLISPFFFPAILYGLPRVPESLPTQKSHDNLLGQPVLVKKHKPDFEAEYIQLIRQKVDACMKEYQPYLQPECNLAYISKLIKIPAHHLAYYFKDVKQQTFNDFRNEWRINHAKNLIREGKAGELTLEAIGLLSGFSSRNTFFTAFKKTEGISPGVFVAQSPG